MNKKVLLPLLVASLVVTMACGLFTSPEVEIEVAVKATMMAQNNIDTAVAATMQAKNNQAYPENRDQNPFNNENPTPVPQSVNLLLQVGYFTAGGFTYANPVFSEYCPATVQLPTMEWTYQGQSYTGPLRWASHITEGDLKDDRYVTWKALNVLSCNYALQ